MAITYEPIATTTLGSATASVTFSSLGSYTDIVLVCSVQSASSGDARINIRFNGDTASNYSGTCMVMEARQVQAEILAEPVLMARASQFQKAAQVLLHIFIR